MKTLTFLLLSILIIPATGRAFELPRYPKIVLEEAELILFKDGKEMQKIRVDKKKEGTILHEIKQKVLRKLKADSIEKIHERGLFASYTSELNKRVRTVPIDPPLLSFHNKKGDTVTMIAMMRPGKSTPEAGGEWQKLSESAGIAKPISRDALVSGNKQYALVREYYAWTASASISKPEKAHLPSHYKTQSNIRLYGIDGKSIWEEYMPNHSYAQKMIISDKGETIAYLLVGEGQSPGKNSANRLKVFDKNKKELINFPAPGEELLRVDSGYLIMSPGGRYVAVGATAGGTKKLNVYFDLETGKSWKAPEENLPTFIDDYGSAYIWVDKGRQIVDLTKHLGE